MFNPEKKQKLTTDKANKFTAYGNCETCGYHFQLPNPKLSKDGEVTCIQCGKGTYNWNDEGFYKADGLISDHDIDYNSNFTKETVKYVGDTKTDNSNLVECAKCKIKFDSTLEGFKIPNQKFACEECYRASRKNQDVLDKFFETF